MLMWKGEKAAAEEAMLQEVQRATRQVSVFNS